MDLDLLKYAEENGMLDMSSIEKQVEQMKRKEYINKHPFKVWQGANGKWYTYLPDEDRPNGRKLKESKEKDKLLDCIVEYWKEQEENPSIYELYDEWISDKEKRREIQPQTRTRYDRQFNECFSKMKNRRIKSISEYDIEDFVLETIYEKKLTEKGYSNFRTLIYGIFKRAKKKKYIGFSITNVMGDIEISRKSFRRERKSDDDLIFTDEEIEKINELILGREDPYIIDYAILLLFKTGMRPGELSSLKKCDVDDNIIHIRRTEVRIQKEGKDVYYVRDFPKTEAGIRDIVVPSEHLWIIDTINKLSPNGEYVFQKNGERIKNYQISQRLETICRRIGIKVKSPNKIRKTYGTILIDSGVPDSVVMSQMGHTCIETTKQYYYKNRNNLEDRIRIMNCVEGL